MLGIEKSERRKKEVNDAVDRSGQANATRHAEKA